MSYTDAMGMELHAEVDRQLLVDLTHYGISPEGLTIDWEDPCGEGHQTRFLGGILESVSDLAVRDAQGTVVAEGWMDFIHGGYDNPLFVFWNYIHRHHEGLWYGGKQEPGIPEHIWECLPETTRDLCTKDKTYDAQWANDPRVRAWRQQRRMEPHRPVPGFSTMSEH